MKDTIIVSGGDIQRDFALDFLRNRIERTGREKLCLIAADRGLEFFMENHLLPDVTVGDFDSLSPQGEEFLKGLSTVEVIRLKPEKDDSDTQCAVNLAIRQGTKRIEILGATGRRVDHLIANLGLLILASQNGVSLALVDQYNYMTLAENGKVLEKSSQFGKYVSFFAIGGAVKGLCLEGFKYLLDGYDLSLLDCGLTVSNEIQEEQARVTYESGTLLMIQSRGR